MKRRAETSHFSIVLPVLACLVLLVASVGCGYEQQDESDPSETEESTMPEPPQDSSITIGSGGTTIAGQGASTTTAAAGTLSPLMFGSFAKEATGADCTECYSFSYGGRAYKATGFTITNGATTFTASMQLVNQKPMPAYALGTTSLSAYTASTGACRKVPQGLKNMFGANAASTTITPTSPSPALPPGVTAIGLSEISVDYTIEVPDAVATACGYTSN